MHVWSLSTVSGLELLKPLEFPNYEDNKDVFCYANEVTLGST